MEETKAGDLGRAFAIGLVEGAPDAWMALSSDGRVLYWNGGAAKLFGYTAEEAQGRLLHELLGPEEQAFADRSTSGPASFRVVRRRKDGASILVDVAHRTVRDDAGVPRFIAVTEREVRQVDAARPGDGTSRPVGTELTERQRLEERAQESDRLKSEFLANMSHELRTPLNAIIGFTALIHEGKAGAVSTTQREYLEDVLVSSRHLLQLINDILDLAKVETGKIEFRPEPVELVRLVGEVRDILRGLAFEKRIDVRVAVDAAVPVVMLDPARTKQILYNYLSNAIKFTPQRGRVTIRVELEAEDMIRIAVEDTGTGIRPEHFERLFREFQQLDPGTNRRNAGTGLGLALTRRIVEAQGGRVAVESTLGQGSTFTAVLPRSSVPGPSDPAGAPAGTKPPG
jgi:PAS domain S-box-containing protein